MKETCAFSSHPLLCPFFFFDVNGKNICKYLILVSIGDTKGVTFTQYLEHNTHLIFTCSKSTTKTLEKYMIYVQS